MADALLGEEILQHLADRSTPGVEGERFASQATDGAGDIDPTATWLVARRATAQLMIGHHMSDGHALVQSRIHG